MNTNDEDETFTRELLKAAGPRPSVRAEDLDAIKDAARAVWEERYGSKSRFRRQRWLLPVAAAVLIFVGVAAWIATRRPAVDAPIPRILVAKVEQVKGPNAHTQGQLLHAGFIVETRDGTSRLALRLEGGQSLRLDAGTRIRLTSSSLVELQRGALYVDSTSRDRLVIRTGAADFRPVGTQFEIRLDAGVTRLRVREGRVSVAHHRRSDIASADEELLIGDDGNVSRARIRSDDPAWQWVVDAAQMPPIDGRTLDSFLRWIAREKGWKLTFATAEASDVARAAILHGSVDMLTPEDALRTVALSSGIEYRVRDGALIVSVN